MSKEEYTGSLDQTCQKLRRRRRWTNEEKRVRKGKERPHKTSLKEH